MVDDDDFDGPLTRNVLRDRLVNSKRGRTLLLTQLNAGSWNDPPLLRILLIIADPRPGLASGSVGPSHPPTLSLLFGSATFFH